jgi:integrase
MAESTKPKTKRKSPARPAKPYKDFPLYAHACGYWAKRINGQIHYFGKWKGDRPVSWQSALDEYMQVKDALYAGRDPAEFNAGLTVEDACNYFMESRERLLDSGELAQRSYNDYLRTCARLAVALKRTRSVASLTPADFEKYRNELAKRLGKVALGNEINRVRVAFKYAWDAGLVPAPVRFGPNFKRPSKRQMRLEKSEKSAKLFTAKEIRKLLDTASEPLRTMILLGINCGLGNADCGRLEAKHLDLKNGWLHFPRPKTGIDRRAALWPETVSALKQFRVRRGLIFRTRYGEPWTKEDSMDNPVAKEFRKVVDNAGLHRHGVGFYSLRHTFETEAGPSLDQAAIDYIMGHEPQHTSAVYRHGVHEGRLIGVSVVLHRWLFGESAYSEAYSSKSAAVQKTTNSRKKSSK